MASSSVDGLESATEKPAIVSKPLPYTHKDVLLGRGKRVSKHMGNLQFRKVIQERWKEYIGSGAKSLVARQIADDIEAKGGRFLRLVNAPLALDKKFVDMQEEVWDVVSKEVVALKIKQAFRDLSAANRNNRVSNDERKQKQRDHQLNTDISLSGQRQGSVARPAGALFSAASASTLSAQVRAADALRIQNLIQNQTVNLPILDLEQILRSTNGTSHSQRQIHAPQRIIAQPNLSCLQQLTAEHQRRLSPEKLQWPSSIQVMRQAALSSVIPNSFDYRRVSDSSLMERLRILDRQTLRVNMMSTKQDQVFVGSSILLNSQQKPASNVDSLKAPAMQLGMRTESAKEAKKSAM